MPVELIHTPGHTPGSQCFYVNNCLVSGDTLFLDGCGRTDLPGGDPEALYASLTGALARVPDDAILFPGHQYSRGVLGPHGRHQGAQRGVQAQDARAVADDVRPRLNRPWPAVHLSYRGRCGRPERH